MGTSVSPWVTADDELRKFRAGAYTFRLDEALSVA